MKRMAAFDFEIVRLLGPPRISCKFITDTNDSITFYGDTVEDIFEQCKNKFPEGMKTKGIILSGANPIDAKYNFCALISLGLSSGYFKDTDFNGQDEEQENEDEQ